MNSQDGKHEKNHTHCEGVNPYKLYTQLKTSPKTFTKQSTSQMNDTQTPFVTPIEGES